MKRFILFLAIVLVGLCLTGCSFSTSRSGKSAYDIAVQNGFVGTEAEWLESLKGEDGKSLQILDIYNAAVAEGFTGTLIEFVEKYFTDVDIEGKSAYDLAVEQGYKGTLEEWLNSLKGEMGMTGPQGDGIDLYAVYQKLIENNEIDCSFLEFVQDYLNVDLSTSYQPAISKAIMSAVSVISTNFDLTKLEEYGDDQISVSAGAGVVYKLVGKDGAYIITNYHVVFDSEKTKKPYDNFYVNFIGGQTLKYSFEGELIGGSATYDIAVLFIKDERLKELDVRAVDVFDSNELVAGTPAIAIGNPQGEGIAVTQGIVSVDSEDIAMTPITTKDVTLDSKGRVSMRVIRIDTPVNSGNSGGGLFNEKGQLIGIVNAKEASVSVENVGYAIPSNIAVYVADSLIRNRGSYGYSYVSKCLIGIVITIDKSYSIYDKATSTTRLYEDIKVVEVDPTSAVYGKVQPNDIVKSLTFNGVTYNATRDFVILDSLLNATVGTSASITVLRDGQLLTYDFVFQTSKKVG